MSQLVHGEDSILLAAPGVPALSTDKVASVLPVDAIRTARAVVVGHLPASIGPIGIEVPVVSALAGLDGLALVEVQHFAPTAGEGERARGGRESDQEGSEGDHDGGYRQDTVVEVVAGGG